MADELLPGLLQCTIPLCSVVRRKLEEHGSPLKRVHISDPAVIRGSLAIVLRSIASKDPQYNYCSLCNDSDRQV